MLDQLPPAWRRDRMLLGDRRYWMAARVRGDDDAVLLELDAPTTVSLLVVGDPRRARELLAERETAVRARLVTLPRLGAGPIGAHGAPRHEGPLHAVDADVPATVRAALGIGPATAWDWLATGDAPSGSDAGVVRLEPEADDEAIRDCLAEANPESSADPAAPGEAAWFGVREGTRLIGVVGAAERAGDPARADHSWHLHGLGVRPEARSRGLGALLTAAATRAAFRAGADWASLGMYASNDTARRVYTRLGYGVEGRFTTFRAVTGDGVA